MIALRPYQSRETRVRHVLKHYYNLRERFFDLTGDFSGWLRDWNELRVADVLSEESASLIAPGTPPDQVAQRGHQSWLEVACRACEQALALGQVYQDRDPALRRFVGQGGVLVVARPAGPAFWLVTCYRPVPGWFPGPKSDPGPWEQRAREKAQRPVAAGAITRTAVRRSRRPALLQQKPGAKKETP